MIRGALIGAGITLALIIVPVVHFVTFWVAPLIGGFVAGSKTAADSGAALGIGALMAAFVAGPLVGILAAVAVLWGWSPVVVAVIGVPAVVYVGGLGVVGAAVGGAAARKQQASPG